MKARAFITYDIVTPESAEDGDVSERGYAAPGGWKFPQPADCTGDAARRFGNANALGVHEVWNWARERGRWWRLNHAYLHEDGLMHATFYDEGDPDQDYTTGEDTSYAVHFECSAKTLERIKKDLCR